MKNVCLSQKKIVAVNVVVISFFSFLMAISAYVRVPLFFTPVPMTLQTLVLYMSVIFLRRQAIFSYLTYLLLGVSGLPVFTNAGSGLLYLAGPTGGYLFGFFVVAIIFPFLLPKRNSFLTNICFFCFAAFCIYLFGTSWLMFIYGFSLKTAFIAGILPFIPGELFKISLASLARLKASKVSLSQ